MRYLKTSEMDSPYDNEPYFERQKMNELIWELDLDPECNYTYDEVMEIMQQGDHYE